MKTINLYEILPNLKDILMIEEHLLTTLKQLSNPRYPHIADHLLKEQQENIKRIRSAMYPYEPFM